MTLLRLAFRQQRATIAAWLGLRFALVGGTVAAYRSTYPTAAQRRTAVELAQGNPATIFLYGLLPDPGTPAQMFVWEIGAFVTILSAILAVLLAVATTRQSEDGGILEIVRSTGVPPGGPLRSAIGLLAGVAALLGLGITLALGLSVGRVDSLTWGGAATFGAVAAAASLVILGAAAAVIVPPRC